MEALIGLILLLSMIAIPVTLVIFLITFFQKKPSKNKWAIACIVSVILFVVCMLTGGNDASTATTDDTSDKVVSSEESKTEKTEETVSQENEEAFKVSDTNAEVADIADIDTGLIEALLEAGYSVEQSTEIQQILNTVGITSIEIENMTGEAQSGLNSVVCYPNGLTDRNRRFNFTTDNGKIFYAGFLDEDLYDADKGGYLKSYDDVHVPETKVDLATFDELQILAVEDVKQNLNYPNTADFDSFAWAVGRSDDEYKIIGTVSAKNAFGVKDDIHFGVWYKKNGEAFDFVGMEFNGARVR